MGSVQEQETTMCSVQEQEKGCALSTSTKKTRLAGPRVPKLRAGARQGGADDRSQPALEGFWPGGLQRSAVVAELVRSCSQRSLQLQFDARSHRGREM